MNNKNNLIRSVLDDHPEFDSFGQVQDECAKRNTEVGLWAVYFVAKSVGRKLERRPTPPDPQEVIRDTALTLLGLHKSLDDAIATLQKVGKSNTNGNRIPWELEKTAPTKTWELSIGQELIDLCGSADAAIKAAMRR